VSGGSTRPSVWRRTPHRPTEFFSAGEIERARRYQRPLNRLRVIRTALAAVVLVALVLAEVAPRLVDALGAGNWVVQLVVVLVGVELVFLVLDTPFDWWVEMRHDRRWELSTQTTGGFLADLVKGLAVSTVIGLVLLVPVYALIRWTTWWWLLAWLVVVGFTVVAGFLFPLVIAPIFNRFEPLEDADLRQRIHGVADRAGVPIEDAFVADESRRSRRDNAYVSGLGASRRVVLFDTILEHPPELLEQVVAHELGHWRRHHLRMQIPLVAALTLVLFAALRLVAEWDSLFEWVGVDGIGDPAGLPLLILLTQLAGLVTGVVTSFVSRAHEREADLEALELLGRPDDAVEMLRRLHVKNLADLDPGRLQRWRASHPPAAERMAFARTWERANAGGGTS
jgi:STE24 endopeptidase